MSTTTKRGIFLSEDGNTGGADSAPISRSAKRPRIVPCDEKAKSNAEDAAAAEEAGVDDDQGTVPSTTGGLLVPPELWAIACGFLPYRDLLTTAVASRGMLSDVMPRVKILHIAHAAELHVGPAARYHDVEDVYVYCMLQRTSPPPVPDDEPPRPYALNEDAAGRIVPFLCRFPRLERAFLGGLCRHDGGSIGFVSELIETEWNDQQDSQAITDQIITSLSGAYRSGALSQKAWISGPRCNRRRGDRQRMLNMFFGADDDERKCPVCVQACQSFPLASVLDFDHKGSSAKWYTELPGAMCSLDVCLSKEEVEAIVMQRLGGKDLLTSPDRILQLLSRGFRHVICNDDNKVHYVVKFADMPGALEALREAIQKIGIDRLKPQEVVDAIMRSFAEDERDPLPPREQCYLAKSSFDALKSFGLPIHEADFLRDDEWRGPEPQSRIPNWRFN